MANDSSDEQITHWKSRHHELARQFDAQEGQWQELEKVLRRLVTRLCIAATGHDAQLDAELTQLAGAIRRDAAADELLPMLESLSKAIVALPDATNAALTAIQPVLRPVHAAVSAAEPAAGERESAVPTRACQLEVLATAISALLTQLNTRDAPNALVQALLLEVPQATNEQALAGIVDRAAELIRERAEQLLRERASAAALLTEVTTRLSDFADFIASDKNVLAESFAAGQSLNEKVLSDVQQLSSEAQSATDLAPLRRLIATRVESISQQVRQFRERETSRLAEHTARTSRLSSQVQQLTQRTRSLESDLQVERQRARIDALTGIANRAAFEERLRAEIARCARSGQPLSLLYWDIDHFKSINDRFGHAAGDKVLCEVANCLVSRIRDSDFIARIGGEEFVTLLMNTPATGGMKAAEQLRLAVAALRMHYRGAPVAVTISCGVTEVQARDSAEAAVARADAALYRAKDSGRNVCIAA